MDAFRPVARRQTLASEIERMLRERITSGGLRPGDRLPTEQQLASSFQVSRTVIREAVSSLKHEGLIDTRPGAGAFVADGERLVFRVDTRHLDREQALICMYEVRFAVEPLVAGLAAERRDAGDVADMRAALDRLQAAIADGSGGADADAVFHAAVVRAARNPYFLGLADMMQATMVEAMRFSHANTAKVTRGPVNVWREHQRIVAAIEAGDADAARRAARSHLRNAATRLSISHSLRATAAARPAGGGGVRRG